MRANLATAVGAQWQVDAGAPTSSVRERYDGSVARFARGQTAAAVECGDRHAVESAWGPNDVDRSRRIKIVKCRGLETSQRSHLPGERVEMWLWLVVRGSGPTGPAPCASSASCTGLVREPQGQKKGFRHSMHSGHENVKFQHFRLLIHPNDFYNGPEVDWKSFLAK